MYFGDIPNDDHRFGKLKIITFCRNDIYIIYNIKRNPYTVKNNQLVSTTDT